MITDRDLAGFILITLLMLALAGVYIVYDLASEIRDVNYHLAVLIELLSEAVDTPMVAVAK